MFVHHVLKNKSQKYLQFSILLRIFVDIVLRNKLGKSLNHIATIKTGAFEKPIDHGEIIYIQPKYFNEFGRLATLLKPDLPHHAVSEKHILKSKDILFAAKGAKNFAYVYDKKEYPAVASTSFFVIRLVNEEVLPEYLASFLNHPKTNRFLKRHAKGTAIASISKSLLAELEIPIPPLKTQRLVLEIDRLRNVEKELIQKIENLKEKQIQQHIINALA